MDRLGPAAPLAECTCGGIAVTLVLNLTVSFLPALRLALQTFDVPLDEQRQLLRAFVRNFFKNPSWFLLPPKG
jgi:site-specific recombinase